MEALAFRPVVEVGAPLAAFSAASLRAAAMTAESGSSLSLRRGLRSMLGGRRTLDTRCRQHR
jgi:hypothetical protein